MSYEEQWRLILWGTEERVCQCVEYGLTPPLSFLTSTGLHHGFFEAKREQLHLISVVLPYI